MSRGTVGTWAALPRGFRITFRNPRFLNTLDTLGSKLTGGGFASVSFID